MTTRGLWKLHNVCNNVGARQDWLAWRKIAEDAGRKDLADKYEPPAHFGWRRIDKRIAMLRSALNEAKDEH